MLQMGVMLLVGEREKHETSKAIQACNDYLRLGPGRTVPALFESYSNSSEKLPPTQFFNTLRKWCGCYNWVERASLYDEELERRKTERANQIMTSGLALPHERVVKLKALADLLEEEIDDEDRVWLPDVKQIGGGEFATRVDLVRFNAQLISEYRDTLNDLARETGGRKPSIDLTTGGRTLDAAFEDALVKVYGMGKDDDSGTEGESVSEFSNVGA